MSFQLASVTRSLLATAPALSTGAGHHSSPPIVLLIVGIFFVLVGGLQVAFPRLGWRASSWQYKNPQAMEPSNAGLMMRRGVAAIIVVVGVVVIVIAVSKL